MIWPKLGLLMSELGTPKFTMFRMLKNSPLNLMPTRSVIWKVLPKAASHSRSPGALAWLKKRSSMLLAL